MVVMDGKALLALLNFVLCLGVVWACICRLAVSSARVRPAVRWQFVLMLAGAAACGLQPWLFGTLPGVGTVLLAGALLSAMALGTGRWRDGPPEDVRCDHLPVLCLQPLPRRQPPED
jgi:hypothetical protein